ncbi:MAG: helix-turn-helix domain-containing protein [Firmicutes bacterium]|nr:helix-turn-helix domain-containing protein [Bacillota bacterium]
MNKEYEEMKSVFAKLPKDLGSTIKLHRERLGIRQERLSELSKINQNTISRIERGNVKEPKFETLVAIMVGLRLHYSYVEDILGKSGYMSVLYPAYITNNEKYIVYKDILLQAQRLTIDECNAILTGNGIEPFIDIK